MKRNLSRVGYQEAEDPLEWRKEKQRETSIQDIVLRAETLSSSYTNPRQLSGSISIVQLVKKQ
ncbi:MAG: hypothetical protein GPJ52_06540 [Candidatus Heimdallarchaeota archaeon]|nr:hypothetical protein [Candidatus Heimdallarchaeota archaeon]